mgnify:CR=1 FL=1
MEWVRRVWARHTSPSVEKLLYCDNLDAQVAPDFKKLLATEHKTTVYYGPANLTEDWQPIDAGFGKRVKEEYRSMQEKWLEENQERWAKKKIPARERRILVTKWVAAAVAKVNAFVYPDATEPHSYIWRLFEKTGCLLTVTGERDDRVHPQSYPEKYYEKIPSPASPHKETSMAVIPVTVKY